MFDPPRKRAPRILVVDDHPISRSYLAAALRENTHSVKQVSCARDAVIVALTWLPDVVLMDVGLADADGYEAARRIREQWPGGAGQPRILMVSAEKPRAAARRSAPAAIDGFLLKPVSMEDLAGIVRSQFRSPFGTPPPAEAAEELPRLFRNELTSRLETLDRCIGRRDLAGATGVVHQLIASAALCGQTWLERELRALNAVCREDPDTATLARAYFSLLSAADEFLRQSAPRLEG